MYMYVGIGVADNYLLQIPISMNELKLFKSLQNLRLKT